MDIYNWKHLKWVVAFPLSTSYLLFFLESHWRSCIWMSTYRCNVMVHILCMFWVSQRSICLCTSIYVWGRQVGIEWLKILRKHWHLSSKYDWHDVVSVEIMYRKLPDMKQQPGIVFVCARYGLFMHSPAILTYFFCYQCEVYCCTFKHSRSYA